MCAGLSFVFAVVHTTVANVVFIMASSPLFAALGACLLMRERVHGATLAAMLLALAGIGVMMSEGLTAGSFAGYGFALGATLGFAGLAVVVRRGGGINMLPAVCWGAAFNMPLAFAISGGALAVSGHDLAYCLFSGGVLTAGGAICFMQGARYVPAAVLAFLSLTEVVLAPVWTWLAFAEIPSAYTLWGGAVVLAAILAEIRRQVRSRGRSQGPSPVRGE